MKIGIWTYQLIAFVEGGVVMATEMLCGRWLSSIFGSATHAWTAVLSITLLCLTIGYFLGGILSNSKNPLETLKNCLLSGACGILLIPFLLSLLLPQIAILPITAATMLMTFVLLSLPLISLAATTPLIINLYPEDSTFTNAMKAGRVYAFSTAGGIIATYITGLLIIENWGIYYPLIVLSIIVLCLVVGLFSGKLSSLFRSLSFYLVALMCCIFYYKPVWAITKNATVLYSSDGIMGNLRVEDVGTNTATFRQLINNNAVQSSISKNDISINSKLRYVHTLSAMASIMPLKSKTLLIGMAGGALVAEFQKLGFIIDAVDIDSRTYEIAKKYFYLDDTNFQFIADDGRHYINSTHEKYDLIVLDISISDSQPYYLYSLESFEAMKNILNPEGIILINYIDHISDEINTSTKSILKSLSHIGFAVDINKNIYKGLDLQGLDNEKMHEQIIVAHNRDKMSFHNMDKKRMNACCLLSGCPLGIEEDNIGEINFQQTEMATDDHNFLDAQKMAITEKFRSGIIKQLIIN